MLFFVEAKKRKNKSWLIILTGFFILLLGVGTITYYFVSNKQLDNLEEDALKTFYIEEEQINKKWKSKEKLNILLYLKSLKLI